MSNVPRLRFPEFSGEWQENYFKELVVISNEKVDPKTYKTSCKCIELENLNSNDGILLGYGDSRTQKSIKNRFFKGQILYGKLRPYLRKFWKAEFDGLCSTEIWVLKGKQISNDFLYYIVQGNYFNEIANISTGSKMPRADWSHMKEALIQTPSGAEQTKIANFFSLFETKIKKQTDKVATLEEYKKGLMQKIFSREIRFKDDEGKDYPEWENRRLGDIVYLDLKPTLKPNKPYIRLGVRCHGKGTFSEQVDKPDSIYMDTLYEVKANQLIVNITFAWEHAIFVTQQKDVGLLVSHRFPTYSFNNDANPIYYKYYTLQPKFNYQLKVASPGGAGRNRVLNKSAFLDIMVPKPYFNEQTKIATFLTLFDRKIKKERGKLDALRELKKGLLQQMFV